MTFIGWPDLAAAIALLNAALVQSISFCFVGDTGGTAIVAPVSVI
jgi:hypothetical protein